MTELIISCGNFDILKENMITNEENWRQSPESMKTIPAQRNVYDFMRFCDHGLKATPPLELTYSNCTTGIPKFCHKMIKEELWKYQKRTIYDVFLYFLDPLVSVSNVGQSFIQPRLTGSARFTLLSTKSTLWWSIETSMNCRIPTWVSKSLSATIAAGRIQINFVVSPCDVKISFLRGSSIQYRIVVCIRFWIEWFQRNPIILIIFIEIWGMKTWHLAICCRYSRFRSKRSCWIHPTVMSWLLCFLFLISGKHFFLMTSYIFEL